MLTLREDDQFFFDKAAADRAARFIETYCVHSDGRFADKPFVLHPAQRKIVRDLFGWKWRKTKLRRFTDCYLEGAVGSGKSPLLAAIGLYGLLGDGVKGAQIFSLASTYGQARVVFDTAKKFVRNSRTLSRFVHVVDREIRHRDPRNGSVWKIVSGKGPGAGAKPLFTLGDEVHEWGGAGAYQDLRDRMFKNLQPLMIAATNAGKTRASFCWQLREKAVAALAGKGELTLYPVIWAAEDEAADSGDLESLRQANPLLGTTVSEASVLHNARESDKDPEDRANFRRLNLGIWPKGGGTRWLDLTQWDACADESPIPEGAPLYVGLDLAKSDDLCAAAYVWVTPERFYAAADFWIPASTAKHYTDKEGIPYLEWGERRHIDLLEELTVDRAVRNRIAARIVAMGKRHPIKAVCYDRAYKAEECVQTLENLHNLMCVPVGQGWGVSLGSTELERRLKEKSISISRNPVLRFCAENAEVKQDDRGNIWPVKPNARGKYAGKRGLKIDGITALVTALTEARKHDFPAAKTQWQGSVAVI